jgi:YegS/Rv2252/BmrU family lipid kinase
MSKTLIILNPHASSGRAGRLWTQIEPILWDRLGELVVAITQHPEEVALHIDKAQDVGVSRVISIGGDGTNHALVNALADINERRPDTPPMVYGTLPIGTGRDWARSQGIPFDIEKAANWIAHATPHPTDVGRLNYDNNHLHFLNIASAGLSGDVDAKVNKIQKRRPWTFLKATVGSILTYDPQHMHIKLDGETWYDERALAVIVANGTTFGHGMKIAPEAQTDDGLFDVILIEAASKIRILSALYRVYNATHLTHPAVQFKQAKRVQIYSNSGILGLDLDGEYATGEQLDFQIRPGLLHLLV